MRVAIAVYMAITIPLTAQTPARSTGAAKPVHSARATPATPKEGIKTPGVRIPFTSLKVDAELPTAPAWMAAADALIAPAAQTGLVKIDSRTNKAADPVNVVSKPCGGAVVGFDSLWAPDCGAGAIARLDAKTWKSTAQIAGFTGTAQPGVAVTADSVWALTDDRSTLARIDPEQNKIVAQIRFQSDCTSLTFAETALWVLCPAEDRLYRVNPQTAVAEKHIDVSANPRALAFGENSLWALCFKDGKVERIDPKTNKVSKTIELEIPGSTRGGIAVGGGAVWVSLDGFPLMKIDAASEKVVQQFWGAGGGAIQFAFNAIWLSNLKEGTLWRIDPRRVAATLAE